MSEIVPKRLKKQQRFIKLIEGMRLGKTFEDIAKDCRVSEKTIDRDFLEWKESGGFDKWLYTEFMILHDGETQKEGKNEAYRVIADLLKKRLREQIEVQGDVRIDLAWENVDSKSQSNIALILDNKNSTAAQQDFESSHAADGSAKQLPGQTKQSDKPSYAE